MSKFLVVCDHETREVEANSPREAQAHCRCRACKLVDRTENREVLYCYHNVRVYRADVDLMEPA